MRRYFARSALVASLLALTAAPAFAGPAETAFLHKLAASWTGHGRVSGPDGGPIACRIDFTAGGQTTRYRGRCTIPDMASQAFSGSLAYNDRTGRYEAHSIGGTVPGTRRGNSLVFTTKSTTVAGTSYSTMTVSPSSLVVDFRLVNSRGEKTSSRVTFTK